ncbi:hypothetical protein [Pyrococcus horikoshii]|uniref:Glycine zipper domain-containing protein n=2 Tax=Pyrococcus horikoshii TaxID=53953 RepID=O58900_PYRHO|nr:hypothetical protein [Pyrococcus horikoshii]BAA30296.1 743aa long hypothetical protein [Pyrococcus horikoshii OT3]HII60209.1 hypothetical protein [Pyrococcus horikoshii]
MWLFSIFKKKQDSKGIKEKEQKRLDNKKKALASSVIMLMLLVSIYAEPAAAFSFSSITDSVKGFFSTLKNNVLGGSAGALAGIWAASKAGAAIGSVFGPVGTLVGFVGGAVIGYIIGAHIEQKLKDKVCNSKLGKLLCSTSNKEDNKKTISFQEIKNVSLQEFIDDTPIKNSLVKNITDETDQAAYQDLQILLSKLKSTLIPYDLQPSGDSGQLVNETLKGPSSIYGFSAFPVVFEFSPFGNDEVKDPICLTNVKIYVKDTNGNLYWTRTWSFEEGEKCGEEGTKWSFETILKGPDPYVNYIDRVLSGQANQTIIEELFNAVPKQFEIVAEVSGYREIYYYNNGQWIFDHKEPFSAKYTTLSGYRHIGGGVYVIGGFAGSLPADYKDAPEAAKFTAFQTKVSGASSNLIARLWSAPLHMLNATVAYRFYVQANPGYFDPFSPSIIDEARIVVYRITDKGTWELAYAIPLSGVTNLGDLTTGKRLDASVNYNAAPGTVSYRAFVAVKAHLTRDDGQQIPLWILAEPAIAPVDPTITRTIDPYITQIGDLTSDNVIDEADANVLKSIADSLISSLNNKIESANYWIKKGNEVGKELVAKYASEAINHYQEAIKYAEKLKVADDSNDVLRFAEIVKEEETIGDYYLRAAQLEYYGQNDQAQRLVSNAGAIEQNVAQYKGGLSSLLAGLNLPSDWSDLSQLLPFLTKIAISLVVIWISRQLLGGMGALIVAILVGIWWFGPMIGISL